MRWLLIFLILSLVSRGGYAAETLTLFGRSLSVNDTISFSEKEAQWLSKNKSINVGVILPSYEPFEVISVAGVFEGISADVLRVISDTLKTKIVVKAYDDNKDARDAMQRGDIDILSVGSWFSTDEDTSIGVYSKPFLKNRLMFSTLKNRAKQYKLLPEGTRVAVPRGLVDDEVFHQLYPKAYLIEYSSPLAAMDAVYFGNADVLLSDIYSTSYLSGERSGDIVFIHSFSYKVKAFGFFISQKEPDLLSLINKIISNLDGYSQGVIASRWSGAISEMLSFNDVSSHNDMNWIAQRKKIIVGVNENNTPYTFLGHEKKPVGITVDVLDLIWKNSGVEFDIKKFSSDEEVVDAVLSGNVDLIATYQSMHSYGGVTPTMNYNRDDIVVLISDKYAVDNGGRFDGKKIAISKSRNDYKILKSRYPNSEVITVRNGLDALKLLSSNKVDGAVTSLYQAKFFLSEHSLTDKYLILARVSDNPLEFSFAVRSSDIQLLKFMNRMLESIPPNDLSRISYSWRNNQLPRIGLWERYSSELMAFFLLFMSSFVVYFVRSHYLDRELRHRRDMEIRLLDELNFNRALLDGFPMPVSVRDINERLTFCNLPYLRALNVTREEVIGKTFPEIFSGRMPNTDIDIITGIYSEVLSSGIQSIKDLSIKLDEKCVEIYQWVIPFKDVDGNIKGVFCGAVDVTERKELQTKLEVERERSEEANLAKSNFLATMSHELRTPMNAVIGFIELAQQKAKNDEVDIESLNMASEAADSLLELIGGILDISSIEAMKFTINNRCISLNKTISSTVLLLQAVAAARDNDLQYLSTITNDVHVLIDPIRLRQIIYNIIGNAIKFTNQGRIDVNLDKLDESIVVTIKDTGIGIPEGKLRDVFLPFNQAHNNYHSGYAGSGLGLAIVQQLCQIMGGEIKLTSREGIGTDVVLTLPFVSCSVKDNCTPATYLDNMNKVNVNTPRRILVVDDHLANRILMEKQLTSIGCEVFTASDGSEALGIYHNQSIDLIITDCQMPIMNGYELTRSIRSIELENNCRRIGIYGLTASALQTDFDKCIDSGMDDCFFKPFKLAVIAKKINEYFDFVNVALTDVNGGKKIDWKSACYKEFLECNARDVDDILRCLALGDNDGVMHHVHRLKGSCQMMGLDEIVILCKSVEHNYRDRGEVEKELIDKVRFAVLNI